MYIATPSSSAAKSPPQTARWRSWRRSTSGVAVVSCSHTQPASSTAAAANSPSTIADVHPHALPWPIASSSTIRPAAISSAPRPSSARPWPVLAGTTSTTATIAAPLPTAPSANA